MNRRFFLEGIGYTTLASLIAGCGNSSTDRFNVQILRRSLPVQLLRQVKKELDPKVGIKVGTQTSVSELFGQLQTWKQKESTSDPGTNELRLVGLGDYWLTQAISENLIRPLNINPQLSKQLPPQVQQLMQRDEKGYPSAEGAIWGAPYRWGATVIVYRKDRLKEFDWELRDWSDFWRPELQGRVGLLNQPREVIGMTLHTLGLSYNDPNPNTHQELAPQLKALHQQTKFYGSTNYLQALMLGDTCTVLKDCSDGAGVAGASSSASTLNISDSENQCFFLMCCARAGAEENFL